ncbi:hypothetical protein [Streptomyces sp. NPDC050263]|uniref:hypothetical protein n=1 Tax=Streptomyces sp. NPDC050263 TaxID=3155037 RepID=UPI003431D4BC
MGGARAGKHAAGERHERHRVPPLPRDDHPTAAVWGIRVDGTDLRALTAWATRELWRPELENQFEEQERESAELIWRGHDGLGVSDFEDRPDHFLTDDGVVAFLGCPCGLWACR